jgi:hypothetical protein
MRSVFLNVYWYSVADIKQESRGEKALGKSSEKDHWKDDYRKQ